MNPTPEELALFLKLAETGGFITPWAGAMAKREATVCPDRAHVLQSLMAQHKISREAANLLWQTVQLAPALQKGEAVESTASASSTKSVFAQELPEKLRAEVLLAQEILRKSLVPLAQVNECLEELQTSTQTISLGQILLKKHYLRVDEFLQLRQWMDHPEGQESSLGGVALQEHAGIFSIRQTALPHSIDRYEIIREIARGGMGIVYEARDPVHDRVVALKMMIAGEAADPIEVERFLREAKLAAGLNHPCIVPIYEVGVHEGAHFFTMDYIAGLSLSEYVRQTRPTFRKILKMILQVAEALSYAHSLGVIHRDLKPANIMVDATHRPLLMDFGLARQMGDKDALTMSGVAMGTPAYMPPEQAQGKRHEIDECSDIYSLGAVLYELLAGRPPFSGTSLAETLQAVIYQDPVPLRQLVPGLPVEVETICHKCLRKERQRRYPNAKALVRDLDRFLKGEGIRARPLALWERAGKWFSNNKVISLALAFIALLMGIFSFSKIADARQQKETLHQLAAQNRALQEERQKTVQALALAYKHAAEVENKQQQAEAALKQGQAADQARQEQTQAQKLLGEVAQWVEEKRELKLIEEKLSEAKALAPWYAGVYREWGATYYKYARAHPKTSSARQTCLEKALEQLRLACARDAQDYQAWFYIYKVYTEELIDVTKANEAMSQITKINPKNEFGFFGQGSELYLKSLATQDAAQKRSYQDQAISAYSKALDYNENFDVAYNNRGIIYFQLQDYDRALADYSKAIEKNPSANTYNNRGVAYYTRGKLQEALADYQKSLALAESGNAYYNLAVLWTQWKQPEKAVEPFRQAVKLEPSADYHFYFAECLYSLKRNKEAIEQYGHALTLEPNRLEAYMRRGELYLVEQLYHEAEKDFSQAMRVDPKYGQAYNNRGAIEVIWQQYDKALADFNRALELNPKSSMTYFNRAAVHYLMGHTKQALVDYTTNLQHDPQHLDGYFSRANLYYELGQYREALADWQKCAQLSPTFHQEDVAKNIRKVKEKLKQQ